MKLGEKIKLVRKQRGMTQRELGERLHLDGNAANRIAQYESGFRTPKEGRIQVNRFPLLNPVTPV